jgi:hypothetical protein
MPAFVRTDEQERLWSKAKAQAAKQGRAGDYAYITGIFKQMGGMEKSLGSTIPPPFRTFTIPGQIPDRRIIKELQALTAMPSRQMNLLNSTHPCFTPERVVEGLGMSRGQENDWAQHIAKAMTSPNELVMRQDIMSKMYEERMDADLRRVLFQRSMSLWREKGRMAKSVSVVSAVELKKAGPFIGPRGGKWKDAAHTIPWEAAPEQLGLFVDRPKVTPGERKEITGMVVSTVGPPSMEAEKEAAAKQREEMKAKAKRGEEARKKRGVTPAQWYDVNKAIKQLEPGKLYDTTVISGKFGIRAVAALADVGRIERVQRGVKMKFRVPKEKLKKSDPRGGTYVKRVPKAGGGFRYFYDEDKYKNHEGAHVSGKDAAEATVTKAVAGHIKNAGKAGCELSALKPLVKRYGAELVGGMLNGACGNGGNLQYKNGRLFSKSERFIVPGESFEGQGLLKAVGHKYIRRVPKPGGGYKYFYRESAAAREAVAGEEVRLGKHMAKVLDVAKDGTITLEVDGKRQVVKPKQWHDLLTRHYGRAFIQSSQRRAQQTINAVMRHVPRALLEDLKGATDEERLEDLAKRVPAVYDKLKAAFSRAGMAPFAAKRSLSMVLERRGWKPEARALVIGTVIRHRKIGTRDLINASENLAGGRPVHEGHVAAVVELRAPGGNPEAFADKTAEVAKEAEQNSAKLASRFAEAKTNPEVAAQVLAEAMSSEAMQKLQLLAQAFPGLADKAIGPVRKAILGAAAVAPRQEPTTDGANTVVYVAGEGGKPKALEAKYRLVEADTLIASHDPESFARHKDYPEGVQERAYHRDKAEQAKVIRNAQQMDPRFVVNTNPDAVNGPPMVTEEGIVLGGNSRAMSMQRIYNQHPAKAAEMRKYLEDHAHEAGLKTEDIQAMKNPVLIREVQVEDKSKAGLQLLVRQMNESFTQGMDPRTMQVAMGRKLTDQTLQALADSMTEDETLASFLASPRSERFVGSLFRAGVIDNRNVNQYMQKGTRTLNQDGRTLVSRILVGRTVDNADVLSDTGTQMMDSIAGSVPAMVQATSHGKGFDIGEDLGVAVDAFNDLQRRVDRGVIPALDPKMPAGTLNRLYNYFDVLPGIGDPHPVINNERAQVLLEVLIRKRGPVQMAKVFREYAKVAAANPEQQAVMFGAKTSPIDALKQAAGVEKKEPQLRLVASMTGRPERFMLRKIS